MPSDPEQVSHSSASYTSSASIPSGYSYFPQTDSCRPALAVNILYRGVGGTSPDLLSAYTCSSDGSFDLGGLSPLSLPGPSCVTAGGGRKGRGLAAVSLRLYGETCPQRLATREPEYFSGFPSPSFPAQKSTPHWNITKRRYRTRGVSPSGSTTPGTVRPSDGSTCVSLPRLPWLALGVISSVASPETRQWLPSCYWCRSRPRSCRRLGPVPPPINCSTGRLAMGTQTDSRISPPGAPGFCPHASLGTPWMT